MLRLIPILLFLPFHVAAGQEIPHTEHLVQLDGYITTYYAPGCETKAVYLQDLLEDAVSFYEEKLEDTFDLKLLVLNREACNHSADISTANYVAYQAKFHELAQEIFRKEGWSFFNEHLVHFQELAERVRHEQKRYTSEEVFNYSVAYLAEAEPEVFNKWKATMKKSPHYFIILIILVIPVAWSVVRKRFKALFYASTALLLLWISLFLLVRI